MACASHMSVARLAILLACSAGIAAAVEYPETARKMVLKDGRKLGWTAIAPPGVGTSPLAVGATLEVRSTSGETASFALPAPGWSLNTAGTYTYSNPLAPGGPSAVRKVTLKPHKVLKVVARSSGLTLDESTQGSVSVALTFGGDVYCSTCTTPVIDQPGRYIDTLCPAPAACAGATTTTSTSTSSTVLIPTWIGTTSTSSTSTSLYPPTCGNGVTESPEQCDGSDLGICPTLAGSPPEFQFACEDPGYYGECRCCLTETCMGPPFPAEPFDSCCGTSTCTDITGYSEARLGVCIPPSCQTTDDCHGLGCVDGSCCGSPRLYCGELPCCPGAICQPAGAASFCCIPPGASCTTNTECCSNVCTGGICTCITAFLGCTANEQCCSSSCIAGYCN